MTIQRMVIFILAAVLTLAWGVTAQASDANNNTGHTTVAEQSAGQAQRPDMHKLPASQFDPFGGSLSMQDMRMCTGNGKHEGNDCQAQK